MCSITTFCVSLRPICELVRSSDARVSRSHVAMRENEEYKGSLEHQIRQCAYELFTEHGIRAVSVDDVCRRIGISKKTFYTCYASKEQLVSCVVEYQHSLFDEPIRSFVRGMNTIELFVFAIKKVDMMARETHSHQRYYELQKYYPRIYEEEMKRSSASRQRVLFFYIEQGKREGYIHQDSDSNLLVIYFMAIQNALARLLQMKNPVLHGRRYSKKHIIEDAICACSHLIFNDRGQQMLAQHQNDDIKNPDCMVHKTVAD